MKREEGWRKRRRRRRRRRRTEVSTTQLHYYTACAVQRGRPKAQTNFEALYGTAHWCRTFHTSQTKEITRWIKIYGRTGSGAASHAKTPLRKSPRNRGAIQTTLIAGSAFNLTIYH